MEGFYREVTSENRIEVAIAEASIGVFKTGYNNYADKEQVRVERSRRINPKSTMAKSVFNFEGGTYLRNNDDLINNSELIDHSLLNNFLLCYGWRKISLMSNFVERRKTINLPPKGLDALITELKAKKKKLRKSHGNANITYFNPGYNSSVVGILQGISSEGVPFQTRFRYRVKRTRTSLVF